MSDYTNEIVTTTLHSWQGKLIDNFTVHSPLIGALKKKGRVKKASGGYEVREELDTAANAGFQRFSGGQELSNTPHYSFRYAKYDWRQAAVPITMTGLDELMNSGQAQVLDLAAQRIKNAMDTFYDRTSEDLLSAGLETNQLPGLKAVVAEGGQGTVGGIDAAANAFWRNRSQQITSFDPTTINSHMAEMQIKLTRGKSRPDIILADNTAWLAYHNHLSAIQRITDTNAESGFATLTFMGNIPVYEGGFGDQIAAIEGDSDGKMYHINSKHISWRPHKDCYFKTSEKRISVNQDAWTKYIMLCSAFTTDRRQAHGVLYV